jgi:hypothetical protein
MTYGIIYRGNTNGSNKIFLLYLVCCVMSLVIYAANCAVEFTHQCILHSSLLHIMSARVYEMQVCLSICVSLTYQESNSGIKSQGDKIVQVELF